MDTDAAVVQMLATYDAITVVGASTVESKPAYYVPAHMQRHGWRIVPVNPLATTVLGERAYRSLEDVDEPLGLVNVFRPSRAAPGIVEQAIAGGATAIWLQLGITSDAARSLADAAGLLYVEDRCLLVEQRRLGVTAPESAKAPARRSSP